VFDDFYKGRRVLVTGHTGFKGAWLALWLKRLGADVSGIALPPASPLGLYASTGLDQSVKNEFVDVSNFTALKAAFDRIRPEVVFHLAAQAIVGSSFEDPLTTFRTNVIGTANLLECVRTGDGVLAAVMITSDKCYENVEQLWGYREIDRLGGEDPYSASKAAAENVIHAYQRSFFDKPGHPWVASVRAGNVVGGGDWSQFRLVPDCVRALREEKPIKIRNPKATRPWQFVLDPLSGYLAVGARLAEDGEKFSSAWNFGPSVNNNHTVERGAEEIVRQWGSGKIEIEPAKLFHESHLLQLDCTKARHLLGWHSTLDFEQTMAFTTAWFKRQFDSGDRSMLALSQGQLDEFSSLMSQRQELSLSPQ
jgi:CDP-glucose 4,6-dehydratase